MVSSRSMIFACLLPSAGAVRPAEFVIGQTCDSGCPPMYEAITDKDICVSAARATADQLCITHPVSSWEDAFEFDSAEIANRPGGCYTYVNQESCGLRLNNFSTGWTVDEDCGRLHLWTPLCKFVPPFKFVYDEVAKTNHPEVLPAIAFVDDEVGLAESCPFSSKCTNSRGECATCTRSPWYADDHRCVCGPATSDWMTEDECTKCPSDEVVTTTAPAGVATTAPTVDMKYIIMESCDNSPCPEGYEPITDEDTCIEAASTSAEHMACHDFDGVAQPWGDVFQSVEVADMPTGCYTYGACRHGCGLYLNTFAHGSNATCGDCYATSLLCKRKETEVLV